MERYLSGIAALDRLPDALYIADLKTEKTAVAEAQKTGVKLVAVCDSNVNPLQADYIIPANDDAVNSIKMMVDLVAEAAKEGRLEWEKNKVSALKVKEDLKSANINISQTVAPSAPKKERRAIKKEESI